MTTKQITFLIEQIIVKVLQEEKEYPKVKMNWVENNIMILGSQPFFEAAMQFINNKELNIKEANNIYNSVESNHRNTTKITFKTNEAAQKAKEYFTEHLGIIFDKE